MTKQKKPKTGDVVGWAVISRVGAIATTAETRKEARYAIDTMNEWGSCKPYRLGKVILSKLSFHFRHDSVPHMMAHFCINIGRVGHH